MTERNGRLARWPVSAFGWHARKVGQRVRTRWAALPPALRRPLAIAGLSFRRYSEDHCSVYAGSIAYYAIFSLVPLAAVVLSICGLVVDRQQIVDFVFEQLPLEESASVKESVDEIVRRAQDVSPAGLAFGLLALLWSGTGIFSAVRRGLNVATHVSRSRPFWRAKLVDFLLLPVLAALTLASLLLTASAQVVIENAGDYGAFDVDATLLVKVVAFVLPAVASFATFLVVYRFAPAGRLPPRDVLTASLLAMVLFEIVKNAWAIVFAITPFSRQTAVYASFGAVFAFLLWMFINASILLFCAEVAGAARDLRRRPPGAIDRGEPLPPAIDTVDRTL